MNQDPERASVLVAGGGPCGLTLSIELGRRGIDTMLVDAKPGTAVNPQANATQARTMEYYRRLGFADEVRALGLPADYPTDIAYFTRYADRELARFSLPSARKAKSMAAQLVGSWSTAELPHRVSQKFVEQVLRRHAGEAGPVSLNYEVRLDRFEERDDCVVADVTDLVTGVGRSIRADYLIGVDGARSTVRRQLGVQYGGETGVPRDFFGGTMVAVYLRAPDFYKAMPHPKAWMYWAFNTERRAWMASVNGRDEFAFHTQLKPGEEHEAIDENLARRLVQQAMGSSLEMEVIDVGTWVAGHALVAESLGGGRVYIGGDAAHLFTPAGGLGYNTAVEDAVNLGWKLAAAVKGVAGPALLPSYAYERRRLAIRNTGYARELATSIGTFVPHAEIESEGAEGDALRVEAGEYLNGHARREFDIPGVTFGGRYDGSPVIADDGTPLPPEAANIYVPSAKPGGRAPHVWLADGGSLFDLFGFDWTLLSLCEDASENMHDFARAAQDAGLDLVVVRVAQTEVREIYAANYALIRPDQIVAWRSDDLPDNPRDVLNLVMGHAAAPEDLVSDENQR